MNQETDVFESMRPRLFGLAYRMLGIVADAQEVVQEAFLRWRQAREEPRSDEAWLVSVTTRIAIDRLRRAAIERAAYRGQWLPEPVAAEPPDQAADLADDLSMAFLLMLERLGPEERAALLLREVFEAQYADIARVLDKSEAACRQIVHRAKERVRRDRGPIRASPEARERVTRRFVEALRAEDREGLLALMTADAILVADGGGRVPAVAQTQRGAERISQLLVGFERATRRHLEHAGLPMPEYEPAWLNGDPAVLSLISGRLLFANVLHLDGEGIAAVYRVMNPAKLAGLGYPLFLDSSGGTSPRRCVGAIVRNSHGQVFVQRRAPGAAVSPGAWDIVGGHVLPGESELAALTREVFEETGWAVHRVVEQVSDWEWTANDIVRRERDYLVEVTGDLTAPRLCAAEHDAWAWICAAQVDMLIEPTTGDTRLRDVVALAFERIAGT